ncbi:hypothetical protein [Streptomyces sp. B93]|uniref:hypothetical protein n=1 Tax=Streptomyces sp. B93 TaxID=2824875 RepID=UPI001FFD81DF|nr:hypothetical protein [Streptomyces sp. B93]
MAGTAGRYGRGAVMTLGEEIEQAITRRPGSHGPGDLMRRHEGRDPQEILAPELPNVLTFEENKQFVRGLLDTQMDLTTPGTGYVREAHERFERMQEQTHGGEYRHQTEGPHPDTASRER